MRWLLPVLALATALMGEARARAATRAVEWTEDGVRFRSVLVWDDAGPARRPGLLMVPNWYGVNDVAVAKAARIAGRDYVVLLTDVYGDAIRPRNTPEAAAAVTPLLRNRALLRARMTEALARFRGMGGIAPIDETRLAAIGFCFGGAAVLDLARTGADIRAAVSFHGELGTDDPSLARNIRARVLAMNGADDALTAPDFAPFQAELRDDPAPWQFVVIGHAVHCFTEENERATSGMCRYDQAASAIAYREMRLWLDDSFR